MTGHKRRIERFPDKEGDSAVEAEVASTRMDRFRTLARRIVNVPTHELSEQQKQYEDTATQRRRARRLKSTND
jgi:hypothetical protein